MFHTKHSHPTLHRHYMNVTLKSLHRGVCSIKRIIFVEEIILSPRVEVIKKVNTSLNEYRPDSLHMNVETNLITHIINNQSKCHPFD